MHFTNYGCGIAKEHHHPKRTLVLAKLPSSDAYSKWASEAYKLCDGQFISSLPSGRCLKAPRSIFHFFSLLRSIFLLPAQHGKYFVLASFFDVKKRQMLKNSTTLVQFSPRVIDAYLRRRQLGPASKLEDTTMLAFELNYSEGIPYTDIVTLSRDLPSTSSTESWRPAPRSICPPTSDSSVESAGPRRARPLALPGESSSVESAGPGRARPIAVPGESVFTTTPSTTCSDVKL